MQEEARAEWAYFIETGDAFQEQAHLAIQNKALLRTILHIQIEILRTLNPEIPAADILETVNELKEEFHLAELANLASRYPIVEKSLREIINRDK
jgi:hypothetical protein